MYLKFNKPVLAELQNFKTYNCHDRISTIVKTIYSFYFRYTDILMSMKNILTVIILMSFMFVLASCNLFKPKYGCPTNGKNIGAEKLAAGDPDAEKAARKAKKFRS